MIIPMRALGELKLHLISFGLQRIHHGDVLQMPVALWVIRIRIIVERVFDKNADRFLIRF
jgi:hypothetical protein